MTAPGPLMDIDLLKTFVAVNRTRHFGRAADDLFVTQAAVSARIRQLEAIVGMPLFTRDRNNIQLTVAGEKLLGYAETIINTWNRARQEVIAGDDYRSHLAVGAVASLWDMMLIDWIDALYSNIPAMLLHAEIADSNSLLRRIREGTLDLVLAYEAPRIKGIEVTDAARIQLVMVSTQRDVSCVDAVRQDYVYVDWGISFSITHAESFPELPTPVFRVDTARLARAFILARGGCAYLANFMAASDIASGQLHLVKDAPVIDRAVYAAHASKSHRADVIKQAISLLGDVSQVPLIEVPEVS